METLIKTKVKNLNTDKILKPKKSHSSKTALFKLKLFEKPQTNIILNYLRIKLIKSKEFRMIHYFKMLPKNLNEKTLGTKSTVFGILIENIANSNLEKSKIRKTKKNDYLNFPNNLCLTLFSKK